MNPTLCSCFECWKICCTYIRLGVCRTAIIKDYTRTCNEFLVSIINTVERNSLGSDRRFVYRYNRLYPAFKMLYQNKDSQQQVSSCGLLLLTTTRKVLPFKITYVHRCYVLVLKLFPDLLWVYLSRHSVICLRKFLRLSLDF